MAKAPTELVLDTDHSWAVVDVETSGLQPDTGRVLRSSRPWPSTPPVVPRSGSARSSMPEWNPGPVHIHGLTRERLAGAPRFEQIAPELLEAAVATGFYGGR